jgi:LacI family transcriptional regulator
LDIKIKDVARAAGVSVTSVSRVLNGEKYVSEQIKQKVNEAIHSLGYAPSHIARSLKRQKTKLIGVIVANITNNFFSTILSSIEETITEHNYNLLVCNIMENLDKELRYLQTFHEMRVDGIIIMHEKTNDEIRRFFQQTKIPLMFCTSPDPDFPSVSVDDDEASYDATRFLYDLGHRRIAFIGGDLEDPFEQRWVRFGDYQVQSGYDQMKAILQSGSRPTAVFAASDDMAFGAMNCLHDCGFQVPEQVSVIGFDGSQLTELARPKLTSMQQPFEMLGRLSVEHLLQAIEDPDRPATVITLPHQLVIRDSCRAPVDSK